MDQDTMVDAESLDGSSSDEEIQVVSIKNVNNPSQTNSKTANSKIDSDSDSEGYIDLATQARSNRTKTTNSQMLDFLNNNSNIRNSNSFSSGAGFDKNKNNSNEINNNRSNSIDKNRNSISSDNINILSKSRLNRRSPSLNNESRSSSIASNLSDASKNRPHKFHRLESYSRKFKKTGDGGLIRKTPSSSSSSKTVINTLTSAEKMLENVKKQMHGVPIDSSYPEPPTRSSFLDSDSKIDSESESEIEIENENENENEREIHSEERSHGDVGADGDVTAPNGNKPPKISKSDEEESRSGSVNLLNEGMDSSISSDLDEEDNENTEYYKSDKERLAEMTLDDKIDPSDTINNSVTTMNDTNDQLIRKGDEHEVINNNNNNNKRHKPNNPIKIAENTEIITIDDSDSEDEEIEAMDISKSTNGTNSNGNSSNSQLTLPGMVDEKDKHEISNLNEGRAIIDDDDDEDDDDDDVQIVSVNILKPAERPERTSNEHEVSSGNGFEMYSMMHKKAKLLRQIEIAKETILKEEKEFRIYIKYNPTLINERRMEMQRTIDYWEAKIASFELDLITDEMSEEHKTAIAGFLKSLEYLQLNMKRQHQSIQYLDLVIQDAQQKHDVRRVNDAHLRQNTIVPMISTMNNKIMLVRAQIEEMERPYRKIFNFDGGVERNISRIYDYNLARNERRFSHLPNPFERLIESHNAAAGSIGSIQQQQLQQIQQQQRENQALNFSSSGANTYNPYPSVPMNITPTLQTPWFNSYNTLVNRNIFASTSMDNPVVLEDGDDRSSLYNGYSGGFLPTSESDSIQKLLENIGTDENEDGSDENLAPTPEEMSVSLLKHQRISLKWLLKMENGNNKGGILADDMGLGKTVQAISLMLAHKSKNPKCKTNLIIAPVSLLKQWANEIDLKILRGHKLSCFIYHQSNKVSSFKNLKQYDVVLTSYNTLASDFKKHKASAIEGIDVNDNNDDNDDSDDDSDDSRANNRGGRGRKGRRYFSPFYTSDAQFYRIFLDEAQWIKNRSSQASKSVAELQSMYRWCLTGTPMQNRVDELYPLIRFLRIKPYNDERKFNSEITSVIKSSRGAGENRGLRKLQVLLSAILLRRTKSSLIDGKPILSLPDKVILKDHVEMLEGELSFYKELETNSANMASRLLQESEIKKVNNYSSILTLLLRLRQACCHNYLVKLGGVGNESEEAEVVSLRDSYESCRNFGASTIERINNEESEGFACSICFDTLVEDKVLILNNCGHIICSDCIKEYFDRFSEAEKDDETRLAECPTCKKENNEKRSITYKLFDIVCNKQSNWTNTKKLMGVKKPTLTRSQRTEKIKELAKSEGKLLLSAKLKKCIALINEITEKNPNDKIIIFSQFTFLFDILQLFFVINKISYLRYDGSMSLDQKSETVKEFYETTEKKTLLLSLKAGNVGLTLTCASHVIILDPFWNPYVEFQAIDRTHRIGQTKEVYVHRILIEKTIEDRIMRLQEEKQEMVDAALDPEGRKSINRLGRRELGFLFGLNGLSEDD